MFKDYDGYEEANKRVKSLKEQSGKLSKETRELEQKISKYDVYELANRKVYPIFRGKTIGKNPEWVCGDFVRGVNTSKIIDCYGSMESENEVDIKTVSLRYDEPIYHHIYLFDGDVIEIKYGNIDKLKFIVKFGLFLDRSNNSSNYGWYIMNTVEKNMIFSIIPVIENNKQSIKILGNITDNPNLIFGK